MTPCFYYINNGCTTPFALTKVIGSLATDVHFNPPTGRDWYLLR